MTSERSFLQEAYYAINFSSFLGDKIGLITSDKNIIFVPLPLPFSSVITHHFRSKRKTFSNNAAEGGRET